MPGPPKFDPTMGDRVAGPPLTLNLVPRERTQESPGAGSSAGPLRLTLGPCASLPPNLTADPKVARIVSSTYNGACYLVHEHQYHAHSRAWEYSEYDPSGF